MSKYNSKKVEIDGIKFDSKLEAEYYEYLKLLKQSNGIKNFILQPKYKLLDRFEKDGKKYREMNYIADFEVLHNDDGREIIDVKGFETADFKIKRKLFDNKYPDLLLTLITKAPKKYGGGWILLDELKKLRKLR